MTEYSETANRILDSAERMARSGGYNGFSFREIATEIGVKSASVHYHFSNKESLGVALAERYTDRFLRALGEPDEASCEEMLQRYALAYQGALQTDGLMCLCGMFGAEIKNLPEPVAHQTQQFFERNIAWLQQVFLRLGLASDQARTKAETVIATLEGGLILSQSLKDPDLFDRIVAVTCR